ncbi:polymorphic toxin type 43 domain-containing protein [Burkholderia ambifaria]|uniref:polymorphic toxin type 43 domain-containing protein n=1 Tax=Burkholderia ambifaria TaxID=152480 RepID=UPI001C936047|nr:polymorphic toxin type 43 domain-containing protein [Burkholderia ambifaria]MBY4770294.1 hypothetical protein [Burkholderia ambifaria]
MDAVASTVGNMVVDQVQGASVAKNGVPSSTDLLTQQAITAVSGQVLPGAIGGVGSGFMPLDTSYNGNVGLFGGVGGVPTTLDAVTSAAAADALAASRAASAYSAATLLNGLGMGVPSAPTQLAGEPFRTSFAEPQPGVQVADNGLLAKLGRDASIRTDAMLAPYKLPRLDPQAGLPKVVGWDGTDQLATNARAAAALDAMRGSPIGGIAGGLAYLSGGSDTTAYFAAASLGSLESIAAGVVGFQMPTAPQAVSYANRLRVVTQANVGEVPSIGWPGKGGSGPAPGVIGITDSTSVNALRNFYPRGGGVEFVYDPTTNRFAAGSPARGLFDGSPHEQLARSIGSFGNPSLVGGTFQRGPNGEFFTTENSGHYGTNWNDAVRGQFQPWLSNGLGLPVNHQSWGGGR